MNTSDNLLACTATRGMFLCCLLVQLVDIVAHLFFWKPTFAGSVFAMKLTVEQRPTDEAASRGLNLLISSNHAGIHETELEEAARELPRRRLVSADGRAAKPKVEMTKNADDLGKISVTRAPPIFHPVWGSGGRCFFFFFFVLQENV